MTRFTREIEDEIADMERRVGESEITWARRVLIALEGSLLAIERHLQEVPKKSRGSKKYNKIVLLKAQLEDCYSQLIDPLVGIEAEYSGFLQKMLVEHPDIIRVVLREANNGRK